MSIKMMTAVWELPLPPSEKLVLLALADWAQDDGRCWPSIKQVADKSGVSERTVQRMLREAEKAGYLTRNEKVGKGCEYTLTPRHSVTPDKLAPVTNEAKTPDTVSPNTLATTIGIEASASTPTAWAKPSGVSVQVWKDLFANRKRKNSPNTPSTWKRFCDDLVRVSAKTGIPPPELIKHAAESGWAGIYDPTARNNQNGQSQSTGVGSTERAMRTALASIEGRSVGASYSG